MKKNAVSLECVSTPWWPLLLKVKAIKVELIMNSNSQRLPPFVAEGKVVRCITDDAEAALYNVSIKLSNTQ